MAGRSTPLCPCWSLGKRRRRGRPRSARRQARGAWRGARGDRFRCDHHLPDRQAARKHYENPPHRHAWFAAGERRGTTEYRVQRSHAQSVVRRAHVDLPIQPVRSGRQRSLDVHSHAERQGGAMNTTQRTLPGLALLGLIACGTEPQRVTATLQANRFAGSEWSEPVNLGPVVNSSAVDANAALSPDEHALYFVSNRLGGVGGNDIWVSRRRCLECPWETPVNLGAPINSGAVEGAPTLSDDGRLLFFFSIRPDGLGSADIYVSHRTGTNDEGDVWGPPVNLGPDVN